MGSDCGASTAAGAAAATRPFGPQTTLPICKLASEASSWSCGGRQELEVEGAHPDGAGLGSVLLVQDDVEDVLLERAEVASTWVTTLSTTCSWIGSRAA